MSSIASNTCHDENGYLAAPLISLGAYWNEMSDHDAYRRMLSWLVRRGYRMSPRIQTLASENGCLPAFAHLGVDIAPIIESGWSIQRALESVDTLPVEVRLQPETASGIPIDLRFALIDTPCRNLRTHVIEVVASGADWNLVDNVPIDQLDTATVERARLTENWVNFTFRALCDELRPEYAGQLWECSLQPPESAVQGQVLRGTFDIYLSDKLAATSNLDREVLQMQHSRVERFAHGLHYVLLMEVSMSDPAFVVAVKSIRDAISSLL